MQVGKMLIRIRTTDCIKAVLRSRNYLFLAPAPAIGILPLKTVL